MTDRTGQVSREPAATAGAHPDAMSLADLEQLAEGVLSREVWDFAAGGSGTERALRNNRDAFDKVSVVPRILSAVGAVDTRTDLLATRADLPIGIAPMAYQRMFHPAGELAVAGAARRANIPFVASTLSSCSIEEITAVGGSTWFQLYWLRDRKLVDELLDRAERSGCEAVMVTVDVPIMGARLRDRRNGFTLPRWVGAANLSGDLSSAHVARDGVSAVSEHTRQAFDPDVTWSDVEALRQRTRLPLVIKGILDPRDAVRAVEAGADGVVVSNHGGRQLDAAVPSIQALPKIVEALSGTCSVLVDSGIRSGLDILRALGLGADGVLIGRPVLWGLALDGEAGVRAALDLLTEELRDALVLSGCRTLADAAELTTSLRS